MDVKAYLQKGGRGFSVTALPTFTERFVDRSDLAKKIDTSGDGIAKFLKDNPGDISLNGAGLFIMGGRSSIFGTAPMWGTKVLFSKLGIYASYTRLAYNSKTVTLLVLTSALVGKDTPWLPKPERWTSLGNYPTPTSVLPIFKALVEEDAAKLDRWADVQFS